MTKNSIMRMNKNSVHLDGKMTSSTGFSQNCMATAQKEYFKVIIMSYGRIIIVDKVRKT